MSYIRYNSPFLWFDIPSEVYVWSCGFKLHVDPSVNNQEVMNQPEYPIEIAGRLMLREVGYHDTTPIIIMLAKNAGVEHLLRKDIQAYKCPKCNKNMHRPDWEYESDQDFFCDNCKKSFSKKKILGAVVE